jgi:hypothetical protein
MRNSLFNKKIPTLLGLILLGLGIFSLTFLANNTTLFTTRATPVYAPTQVRITNVSESSFTVSFLTEESVLGTLSYGTTETLGQIALDDRDQQDGTPKPYSTHHITVKNLKANTQYYFSIIADDKIFLDEEIPFSVKTLSPLMQSPSAQSPIVGKVVTSSGAPSGDIIVFLVGETTQPYSVLSKKDGSYVMPLNAIRTKDLTAYAKLSDVEPLSMLFVGTNETATATLFPTQINPVPQVTLSNTYDFTIGQEPVPSNPTATSSGTQVSFPSFEATEVTENEPKILSPDQEEGLSDQQPLFEGTALPNESVEILIQSNHEISTTIQASNDGSWSFRPDTKLEPGEHTITIKTKDSNGILKTIRRSFTVFAEGSQFTEPSVSPSQATPTPTVFIAQSPTPTLTPTPTSAITPSATPSAEPTATTPTPTVVPPPDESPGSATLMISIIMASIIFVLGIFSMKIYGVKR